MNRPGVYEYPLGTPLSELIEAAGGVKGKLKAVFVGGLSVPVLTAEEAKALRMDFDSCAKAGTMLGSGGIMVMNESVSIPRIALRAMQFYVHESCGQCGPCREGSIYIEKRLTRLAAGEGSEAGYRCRAQDVCDQLIGLTLCPTGTGYGLSIRSLVQKFRKEFEKN